MNSSTYTVGGMTCQHCVQAVTDELRNTAGLSDISIELPTGRLTVTSDDPIDDATVCAAVDEAGYEIVG
ncbi:MAG: heavy-metal-associated domain-containing protein [Mycobacteriales bacterium]